MAKELPYFKFHTARWLMGDITLQPMSVQGVFVNLCSYYWERDCSTTLANVKQRFSTVNGEVETLVQAGIIEVDSESDKLTIKFLDEQYNELWKIHENRVKAGEKGGKASVKQRLNTPQPVVKHLDKIKKRKDKIFVPPSVDEVISYFEENQYEEWLAKKAFNHYAVADWKDAHGTPVRNWKQKMSTNWFKDEGKIQTEADKKFIQKGGMVI